MDPEVHKLDFMYKKIHVPYPCMRYWLTIPEFVSAMLDKVRRSKTIDDQTTYEEMVKIFAKMKERRVSEDLQPYNLRLAKRAILRLERLISHPEQSPDSKRVLK